MTQGGPLITRRGLLAGGATLLGAAALSSATFRASYGRPLGPEARALSDKVVKVDFTATQRPTALPCFGGRALPMWTFSDEGIPVIRMRLGDTLEARVANALPTEAYLTVHWHGLRIPNAQDGVPLITQPPIPAGEPFTYRFTPPDPGTFFFHSHCDTVTTLGRGLAGVLIVEGDETEPYDADEVILLKDWNLTEAGDDFADFYTEQGAARAGTFGQVRSANGAINPRIPVPAGADVRLRILNVDATRIVGVGIRGAQADAAVVAIDGCGVTPFRSKYMILGPAQRVDMVIRTPADGGVVEVMDMRRAEPLTLAHLIAEGKNRRSGPFDPAPLAAPAMAAPDLDNAIGLPFEFASSPLGSVSAKLSDEGFSMCSASQTFWTINQTAWPQGVATVDQLPPPIATLQRGQTYVFELANISKQFHPIHMHGHSFMVLSQDKIDLPPHRADTVMLPPRERTRIAFVADNPGDWMFHCHIIEHQETGMMSYLRVT